jgi:hypothetical protein
MLRRPYPWKAGLVVVGGCCAAVAAVAGASVVGTASASGRPPAVDHQLCYPTLASTSTFKLPKSVKLINQFNPSGFVPIINKTQGFHCNPVTKTVNTPSGPQVYKVTNPSAHLTCFVMSPGGVQASHEVQVQNQFGKATLVTGQPFELCLPSWMSRTGPPNRMTNAPPNLNHFTCYPVQVRQGAFAPPLVLLHDAFTNPSARNPYVPVSVKPDYLCVATRKVVGAKAYPIINAATQLLCFLVPSRPHPSAVWDQNQFGTAKVTLTQGVLLDLCVPSTMQIVPT